VGVAIAPERFTYKLLSSSEVFGLNFLDFKYVEKMPFFGDVSERYMRDKLKKAGFSIVRGQKLGAPLISEASATLELAKRKVIEVGDHDLFIGEVEAAYAIEDFEGGIWKLKDFSPIFYLGRTRRPAKVQRFYLGFASVHMRSLELAGGELKPYFERRMEVNNEVRKILEGSGTLEGKAEALISLGRRYGLEAEDLSLLVEDAARDGAVSREEFLKITSIIRGR